LAVSAPGFESSLLQGLRLETGAKITQNVTLAVGKSGQTITVDSGGLAINTTDAAVSTVVNRQFVDNTRSTAEAFSRCLRLRLRLAFRWCPQSATHSTLQARRLATAERSL
jgi:hypothetical protein